MDKQPTDQPLDNKAYLDEIAVKGKKKFSAGPILTPTMIKVLIAGVIAIIAMVAVGNVLSSQNKKTAAIHEKVYVRIMSMADKKYPLTDYQKKVKASELREYSSQLANSATNTLANLKGVAKAINLDTSNISSDVTSENNTIKSKLSSSLQSAVYSGNLDNTYASEAAYQISLLINLEKQARAKTSEVAYAKVLDDSMADLEIILEKFEAYSDAH